MGRALLVLSVVAAAVLGGCATRSAAVPPAVTAPARPAAPLQAGTASWYGEAHHGRRTASGEPFDMHALTAAHPSLPFGTRLRVTNVRNGRTVEVRVNDRGPAVPGRIIDLSYAAARALGGVGAGLFPVELRLVAKESPPAVATEDATR
jgi:rare lipoprotein A